MDQEIEILIGKMLNPNEDEAFRFSDKLAEKGGQEVIEALLPLLYDEDPEKLYLVAQTLSKMENNQSALPYLMDAINDPRNKKKSGPLVEALHGFDCNECFLDIFKLYLFGNFKVSAMAKLMLDYEEFDITPRSIRKAEKHYNHFLHNAGNDVSFDIKKEEAENILTDLKNMFEENQED